MIPSPDAPRDLLQEAVETLQPFAEGADYFDDGESDDEGIPIALSHLRRARALLPRLEAARAAGAVVVPGEPTEEMIEAGLEEWHDIRDAYLAMLAAAPAVGDPETRGE